MRRALMAAVVIAACVKRARVPESEFGAHRCDHVQLAVTDTDYVWIDGDREEAVSIDQALVRLRECAPVLATEKVCRSDGVCMYRITPIWWNAWGEPAASAARHTRVEQLWARVKEARLTMPEPNYVLGDADLLVYRSRAELGPSADLVPPGFDFSRQWLARAFFPSARIEHQCLDGRLGLSQAESAALDAAEAARREELLHGRAARVGEAEYVYRYGKLTIVAPHADELQQGPCWETHVAEAVLVPVPHTRVPVTQAGR